MNPERSVMAAAHDTRARRWQQIDWTPDLPGGFLVPEAYYRFTHLDDLPLEQRIWLNRLALCFTCEQFVNFEQLLIAYLERHAARLGPVSDSLPRRFILEEQIHIEAFYQLLEKVRPDLYPTRTLQFIPWSRLDALVVRLAPVVSFFLMAELLEEVTLHIPVALEEGLERTFPPVYDVMALHAKEERSHVGIDAHILNHARSTRTSWRFGLEMMLCLVLLLYLDLRIKFAWRRAVRQCAREAGIDARLQRRLFKKPNARADVLGVQSFIARMRKVDRPGAGVVCAILERQVR